MLNLGGLLVDNNMLCECDATQSLDHWLVCPVECTDSDLFLANDKAKKCPHFFFVFFFI